MTLSFKQVVAILMDANGIHDDRQSAFESRLKQWQKMGFPEGVNVGKGTRANYGAKQLYQLDICLALLEIGMTPERAHDVVRIGWPEFEVGIVEATECISAAHDPDNRHEHYWFVKYDALSDLKSPEFSGNHVSVVSVRGDYIGLSLSPDDMDESSDDEFIEILQAKWFFLSDMARCILIEIDSLLVELWFSIRKNGINLSIFKDEIQSWRKNAHDNASRRAEYQGLDWKNRKRISLQAMIDLGTQFPPNDLAKLMINEGFGGFLHDNNSKA